ncbi:MAG: inositol monophosphatase [Eubacterium sp.]|nr:inositol monophosphatase [Eubacterium sp.]
MIDTVRAASGLFQNRTDASEITVKGKADFATQVDYKVQQHISKRLASLYPDVEFLGEEGNHEEIVFAKRQVWVLDPVDGTTNLIHDMHASVISLALAEDGQVTKAVVFDPYRDELFSAEKGKGAFVNETPLHVSGAGSLEECLTAVGTSPYHRELADPTFRTARSFYDRCQDIRRSGTAALDLAYIAAGRQDIYYEYILQPWDFAAGILLVSESGGLVTDFDGAKADCRHPSQILATNGKVHKDALGIVRKNL